MANTTLMTYGSYSFIPVPFLTINKEYNTKDDGERIGATYRVTMEGTLTPIPTGVAGYIEIDALQDSLRQALATDGQLFEVTCDSNLLIRTHPRILNLAFEKSTDNWVMTCPYTIELEFDDEPTASGEDSSLMPPYIETAEENWSVQFDENYSPYTLNLNSDNDDLATDKNPIVLRLNHTVSAKGKRHFGEGGLDRAAWQEAREYVVARLGFDITCITATGVFNLDGNQFQQYNHVRLKEQNEAAGSFSVTETWTVINPSGTGIAGRALEDFTAAVRTGTDSAITTVSLDGTIEGLESRTYGVQTGDFTIVEDKYTAALDYWNTVQTKLLLRANEVGVASATRGINPSASRTLVGHNPTKGTITYSYEYDDRPCNFVDGALSENININDTHPADVFAQLTVLGRPQGPVLQDIGTKTPSIRDVSIEVLIQPPSGCAFPDLIDSQPTTEVEDLLCQFESGLTSVNNVVFKQSDTSQWNPKTGAYSRNVSWLYQDCGVSPETRFCASSG